MLKENARRLRRLEQVHGAASDAVTEIFFVPVSKDGDKLTDGEPILFWRKPA